MPGLIPFLEHRFWRVEIGEGESQIVLRGRDLMGPPDWSLGAAFRWRGGMVADAWGALTLRVANTDATRDALAALLLASGESLAIAVHQLEGELDDESAATRWVGVLSRVEVADADITIRGHIVLPGADVPMCRDLSERTGYGAFPPRTWIPQVFGTCDRVAPILLRAPSQHAVALGPITREQTTITLRAPVDWPTTGFLQINDEVLAYSAIEDGITLGSVETPLERGAPRDHAASSEVWRVDEAGVVWLVCDHEATVSDVYVGEEPLTDWTDSTDEIEGRAVTLISRTLLPLERRESATRIVRDALFGYSEWWELTMSSTALRGSTAFDGTSQTGGAIITLTAPVLEADWIGDLSTKLWRHDRIVRALLAFDFTPYPGWRPETLLRVTVSRDESEVSADLSLEGFLDDISDEFRTSRAVADVVQDEIIRFDHVEATSGWADPERAVEGLLSGTRAIATSSDDPETLSISVAKRWPGENTLVTSLRLRVAIESAGECATILRITDEDELDETSDFDAPTSPEHRELEVTFSPGRNARELFENLRAEITLDETGTLEIAEAWLEATLVEPPEVATIEEATAAPLPQRGMELDITTLLDGEFDWHAFNGETPHWRVRFQLIDGSPVSPAVVGRVHFRFETFPASSVRPTTRILATVLGRDAGEDGAALPLEVVRTLLEAPEFANLPDSAARDAAFEAAETALSGREVRFRRVVANDSTVAESLADACGEGGVLLVQAHGDWVIRVLPLAPEGGTATTLDPEQFVDHAAEWECATSGELDWPIRRLEGAYTENAHWVSESSNSRGFARAKWCDAGGEELLETMNAWLARRNLVERVRIAETDGPAAGMAVNGYGGSGGYVQETRVLTGQYSLLVERIAFE